MAKNSTSWRSLLVRLQGLRSSGQKVKDAISDLSSGEPTVFYDADVLEDLSTWIRDAHQQALEERRDSIVVDLRDAVRVWAGARGNPTLYEVGESLTMDDFRVIEEIHTIQEEDRVAKPGEEPTGLEDYADPLDTRYRLQRFVEDLLLVVRSASFLTAGPSLGVLDGKDLCTREELAGALGIESATITKWISAHRRRHKGSDPIWVRRRPGQQRGFIVKVPTFMAEFRAGRAR